MIRDYPESQDVLLPKIFKDILSWDEELQVEGGASLAVIIEEDLLSQEMKDKFHIFILEALESWNKANWDVLCEHYIRHLDKFKDDEEERRTIIYSFVDLGMSLGELSQAIPSRCTGARLMATISNIIDKDIATKRVVPRLINLGGDFNWELRKAVAGHLSCIFNLLSPEEGDSTFFEIMVELLDDEESEVKNFAIEGFFHNIDKFSPQKVEDNCIGIISDLIKNEENTEFLNDCIEIAIEKSEVLRKHFGSPEYMQQEGSELTNGILFKSPGLVETLGVEYFMENIFEHYQLLLESESIDVRKRIAGNFHEMIAKFGTIGSFKYDLHKIVIKLMTDKSVDVQGTICIGIDQITNILGIEKLQLSDDEETDIEKKASSFKLLFTKTFFLMEETIKSNYRHLIRWIDALYKTLSIFNPSSLHKKIIPIVIGHLKGHKETRKFGIEFLGRLISDQSNSSFQRLVGDLSSDLPFASSSFTRSIYLELIEGLTDHISKRLFGSVFLDAYFLLSKDKCSNVLIKFGSATPKIYRKVGFEDSK